MKVQYHDVGDYHGDFMVGAFLDDAPLFTDAVYEHPSGWGADWLLSGYFTGVATGFAVFDALAKCLTEHITIELEESDDPTFLLKITPFISAEEKEQGGQSDRRAFGLAGRAAGNPIHRSPRWRLCRKTSPRLLRQKPKGESRRHCSGNRDLGALCRPYQARDCGGQKTQSSCSQCPASSRRHHHQTGTTWPLHWTARRSASPQHRRDLPAPRRVDHAGRPRPRALA